ncbi:DUF7696 family protein [Cupriavidus plantarum]|uniref:DUF7696 family protein n=1 Tax=Cupriavidus plantarum TaxID=942865 RepID=UPI000E38063D|nr:hypothetical protein [Cupriavidus plantarum]REE85266.1 hypothetical protein C7418_5736 [Cupriavidus plantarum]RLK28558.1 hypothetical protein C7417_5757 [Cupriavidus plantarum]CAG2153808.1 hypothetical protein LMG26296_05389 [Cupriavidus plantarum]SMR86894.1 hypothetical protein SAMN05421735_0055 [Cupriavidus plantarum]
MQAAFQTQDPATLGITMAATIAAAIDAAMLSRRDAYAGQPQAWHLFCEASHVATLNGPLRDAFIARVAEQRGADIALRLAAKADAIREAAIARCREAVPA